MRPGKTILTEAWIRKVVKERDESACGDHTDGGCRGLRLWIAKDFVVTFSIRMRVTGIEKRMHEDLGVWSSAFTLQNARDACAIRRGEVRRDGLKPKVEPICLRDAIPKYETARTMRDQLTSAKRRPLPVNWAEHIARFQKVFAPLLSRYVHQLTRNDFVNCMNEYGGKWAIEREKEWDDKVLRPMMVTAMPFLKWLTKTHGLDTAAIDGIVPEDYAPDERYLLPGEWQACAPYVDQLDGDCGLFIRFLLLTCTRSEQALCMQWNECGWGNALKYKDEEGAEHDALIWIVPRDKQEGGMKGRKSGGNKLPNRVLLTGDALTVLKRLRAIWDEGQKEPRNAGYNGVFTKEMVTKWRTGRTVMQRWIEEQAGTERWDRMTLRHTHATYLAALGCPPALVTMSMVHSPGKQSVAGGAVVSAAPITSRYVGPIASKRFMSNEPLAVLGPWHLRLHKLFRDMERGNVHSEDLMSIIEDMRTGQSAANMRAQYKLAEKWLDVKPTKLSVVA